MITSPQLRESPDTAKRQVPAPESVWAATRSGRKTSISPHRKDQVMRNLRFCQRCHCSNLAPGDGSPFRGVTLICSVRLTRQVDAQVVEEIMKSVALVILVLLFAAS